MVADILTAAIAVATFDIRYPSVGIAALAGGWMSLQNLRDEAFEGLVPYIAARPDPFINAWERRRIDRDDGRFLQLLLHAAKRESVAQAFGARMNRWLGSWSRQIPDYGDATEHARRQGRSDARIEARLAQLTERERRYLSAHCTEQQGSPGLASAAALFLYGRPLAPFAGGIVAFAFAHTLAGHTHAPYEDLSWVVRLNRVDAAEFARAVRAEITGITTGEPSAYMLETAACALRLLGTLDAEREAERLSPRPERGQYVQDRPDPLDPATDMPGGIDELSARTAGLNAEQTWSGMWTTAEDHDLDRNRDMLIRFAPVDFAGIMDTLARSVAERTGMPLRQLAWHMPWLSQIMSEETISATRRRIAQITADPGLVPDGDENFVAGMLVESVLPALEAGQQLDLLQSLPPNAPYHLRYSALAKPLTGGDAANRLEAVLDGHSGLLERTLLFLAASTTDVADRLRDRIATCLASEDTAVAAAAAEFARNLGDAGLDEAVLRLDLPAAGDRTWRGSAVRGAIATAIGRRGVDSMVEKVPVEHLDWVAARLPAARDRLAGTIEALIDKMVRPLLSPKPHDATLVLEVNDDPVETRMDLLDRGDNVPADPVSAAEALKEEMSDVSGAKYAKRRRILSDQADRFLASLLNEDALAYASRPYSIGLGALAQSHRERYAGWLHKLLQTEDHEALEQLQNLGFALAQNYADIDAHLAGKVIAHLWKVESHVIVRVGDAKHAFRHLALFSATTSPELDLLRLEEFQGAIDDGEIERLTIAAVAAGAGEWLDRFIEGRLASETAADHALAITIASFRPANARSRELLGRDWGRGFLGGAAGAGRERYERAANAAHWFTQAASANDPFERWRYTELGIASADRRQLLSPSPVRSPEFRRLGGDLPQRLGKVAEKASTNAAKTLLGQRRPNNLINEVIR